MRLFFAGIMVSAVTSVTFAQPQPEPGVPCTEDKEQTGIVIRYGAHTTGCAISPATDVDVFSFEARAGDYAQITGRSSSANFDPRIELFDPSGNSVGTGSCSVNVFGDACSFGIVAPDLPATGTYFLIVNDSGSNETGSYTFQLERRFPHYCPPTLDYGNQIVDSIGNQGTDFDMIDLFATAGTNIDLTMLSSSANFDPRLILFDPNGVPIADNKCSVNVFGDPCSFSIRPKLTMSGKHRLIVLDDGTTETGSYQINAQCLPPFGCPEKLHVDLLVFSDKQTLLWRDTGVGYDVVRGDLQLLRDSSGDFFDTIDACLAQDEGATILDPAQPAEGKGWFYLARRSGIGIYDNAWGPSQVCGRDPGINASSNACPSAGAP